MTWRGKWGKGTGRQQSRIQTRVRINVWDAEEDTPRCGLEEYDETEKALHDMAGGHIGLWV